ncbi:MAG: CAP domain-containing protein [Planctomycetales bacterium]
MAPQQLKRLRVHPSRGLLFAAVCFAWACSASEPVAADPPGAYRPPSPEPGAVETLLLEFINRCRANPNEDAARALSGKPLPPTVDSKMFQREMLEEKPASPLLFDLRLIKAARWHSHYQILHGQVHDEEPGKKGFTGNTASDRMQAAGFPRAAWSENIFATATDPWRSHLAFVVDWGPGPGGMQAGRGHRKNIMNTGMNVIGVGAVPRESDGKFAVTHVFSKTNQRLVGGVVYNDLNRNRFYDLGEGAAGIQLTIGGDDVVSWTSGAYTAPVPAEASKIEFTLASKRYAAYLPGDKGNIKVDVILTDKAAFDLGEQMLARVKKLPDTETAKSRRFTALVELYFATQGRFVESAALDEIAQLTKPIRAELEQDQNEIRQAASGTEIAAAKQRARAVAKKYYRGRAYPWFAEAEAALTIKESYLRLKQLKDAGKPVSRALVDRAVKGMTQRYLRLTVPEWKQFAYALGAATLELAPAKSP